MPLLCHFLDHGPHPGPLNMAVDEALLGDVAARGEAWLRFYEWSVPTLSLGYFQAAADRQQHAASRPIDMVRRASGGGALVHHHEVTYSLALPAGHPLVARPTELLTVVHQSLADWLKEQLSVGSPAIFLLCPRAYKMAPRDEPYLCFQRRAAGDLLIDLWGEPVSPFPCTLDGRFKVAGSAQRRQAGGLLQHGGLLLRMSPHAPQLPGLIDLAGLEITRRQLVESWAPRLATALGLELRPAAGLGDALASEAQRIAQVKFAADSWAAKR